MSDVPSWKPDPRELQQNAHEYNKRLTNRFEGRFAQGGDLFLGKHYAFSNRILLGINPGGNYEARFRTELLKENFWDMPNREEPYWRNCRHFVNGAPGLYEWISLATMSFCCPWRTPNSGRLHRLNSQTGGKLFQFSGSLVRKLVEDHQRACRALSVNIVAVSRACLYLLASPDFFNFNIRLYERYHNGAKGTFQWAKYEGDGFIVYQVPHFSRANSPARLAECAQWLANDLGL